MEKKVVQDAVRRAVLAVLLIIGVALPLSSTFAAQSITLQWNPSTDPSVVGYNVYYGVASRTYTNKIDVGNTTLIGRQPANVRIALHGQRRVGWQIVLHARDKVPACGEHVG